LNTGLLFQVILSALVIGATSNSYAHKKAEKLIPHLGITLSELNHRIKLAEDHIKHEEREASLPVANGTPKEFPDTTNTLVSDPVYFLNGQRIGGMDLVKKTYAEFFKNVDKVKFITKRRGYAPDAIMYDLILAMHPIGAPEDVVVEKNLSVSFRFEGTRSLISGEDVNMNLQ
jgi:hypothetical protein